MRTLQRTPSGQLTAESELSVRELRPMRANAKRIVTAIYRMSDNTKDTLYVRLVMIRGMSEVWSA